MWFKMYSRMIVLIIPKIFIDWKLLVDILMMHKSNESYITI